jgi:hypothetical protein
LITLSTAARAVTAAAMTAGLALGGAAALPSPAQADSRVVNFSFKYRLTTRSWDQRAGTVTLALSSCSGGGTFHVEFKRDRWGTDSRVGGATIRCAPGQRVRFTAPVKGTYYFVFTKVDDNRHITGRATIAYPGG